MCTSEQALNASERYVVQGFSKPTKPSSGTCWTLVDMTHQVLPSIRESNRYLVPSLIHGDSHHLIEMRSKSGILLAQMTLNGRNLGFEGETNHNPKQLPNGCLPSTHPTF
jgi:hypothetical protein